MTSRKARAGHAEVTASIRDRIGPGLKRIRAKMRSFAASAARIGGSLTTGVAASTAAFVPIVNLYADWDDQMRAVQAVTGATGAEFDMLSAKSRELGRSTSFMAKEVAGGQLALGRAGFKPKEIDESIESVLNLARATGTELDQAAGIGADVLRAFKLEAGDMGRVADVLAVGANSSSQTLVDMFESLKPVAPIAAEAGDSLESLSAASGVLANNGIKGSLAGNSLARAYKNLANSQKQAKLSEFGVDAVDADGNLRPLIEIIQELGQKTEGLGEAARLDAFEQLFGRGQVAALNLANANSGFDELVQKLENADGAAARTAKEMDAGLGGSIRKTLSALEGFGLTIVEQVQEPISMALNSVIGFMGSMEEWASKNQAVLLTIGGVITAAGILGVLLLAMATTTFLVGGAFSFLMLPITLVTGAVSVLSAGVGILIGLFSALFSPIGIVAALLIGGGAAWLYYSGEGTKAVNSVMEGFDMLVGFVTDSVGGIVNAIKAGDWELAGKIAMKSLEIGFNTGVGFVWGIITDVKNFILSISDIIVSGIRYAWNYLIEQAAKGLTWLIDAVNSASEFVAGTKLVDVDTDAIRDDLNNDGSNQVLNGLVERERKRLKNSEDARAAFATDKLQDELSQLIEKAAKKAADLESPEEDDNKPELRPEDPEKIIKELRQPLRVSDLDSSVGGGSSFGSFNASEVAAFARSDDFAKDNLKANERTADAVEDLLDELEDGLGLTVT